MKKRIFLILSALAVTVSLMLTSQLYVFSEQPLDVDHTQKGSVTISLSYDNIPLSGLDMAIYKIADAYDVGGELSFRYTEALGAYDKPLSSLQTPESIDDLTRFVTEAQILPVSEKSSDENGVIVFENLALGIYLVRQAKPYPEYSECQPFLIAVPVLEDGEVRYDVDATPKIEIEKLTDITVRKVWNDDKDEHLAVKVVLSKNGTAVGDPVTLNTENNWTYTWIGLPCSDSYSVEEIEIPKDYVASYKRSGNEFTVINSEKLIQTGHNKLIVPAVAVIGVVLFAVGAIVNKEEKKKL